MRIKTLIAIVYGLVILLIAQCANPSSGTDTGNAKISGVLYNSGGSRSAGAKVACIPRHYNPNGGSRTGIDSTVTNDTGGYRFKTMPADTYNIFAQSDSGLVYIESVVIKPDSQSRIPPDTLKAAGSIRGRIELEPGDDARNVFIIFLGTYVFRMADDSVGNFAISDLAKGRYRVRILANLPNYRVMDTAFTITAGRDSILPQPIRLEYTGIPIPQGLRIEYDTMKQIVTLIWNKPTTGSAVQSYTIYRKRSDSATFVNIKGGVTDTSYNDSTGVQDQTYEYRVAVVDTNTTEGTRSAAVSVVIASYFVLDSTFGGTTGSGQGQFDSPSDIAIAANGDIYIVDLGNNRVQVFDQSMQYKREFGGGIQAPQRIALDSLKNAYVSDQSGNVFVFDPAGTIIDTIIIGKQVIDLDLGINEFYVSTYGHNNFIDDSVSAFSYDGTFKRTWWCGNSGGTSPFYLTVESPNRIWVSSEVENKVRVFDTSGNIVDSINIGPYPSCIAINKTNSRIYINCYYDTGEWLKVLDGSHRIIATYRIPGLAGDAPAYTALHPDGSMYEVLNGSNKILKLRSLLP